MLCCLLQAGLLGVLGLSFGMLMETVLLIIRTNRPDKSLEDRFPELFDCVPDPSALPALSAFLSPDQPACRLADFSRACHQAWAAVHMQPPPVP